MKVKDVQHGKTTRKSFARIEEILEMPNLIEVQKKSYEWFLDQGLREVFDDTASITDYTGNLELSFLDFSMDEEPKYSIEECKARDATYATPLKVRMRLRNKETGEIKEQEIFMGDFPKMTHAATFIINGAERAIVSQLVRSPGVYYGKELDKTDKVLLSATVIPYRGAWLEYETDANDVFYVRIDKNRKIPITSFIRAIGVKTDAEIKELFGEDPLIVATLDKDPAHTAEEALIEIYKKMRPGEPPSVESATSLMDAMFFDMRRYDISAVGRYKYNKKLNIARRITGHKLVNAVADPMTGEVLAENGEVLSREKATMMAARGVNSVVIESAEGTAVKVFGNGMVDVNDFSEYLGGATAEDLGLKEKVRFTVLKEIIDSGVQGDELKKTVKERHFDLVPKTIIVDDMLASICYLLNLGHAHAGDILHEVDGVDGQIHHRAAACFGFALPPVAGLIRKPERKLRIAGYDRADLALGNGFFHTHDVRTEAHHEARCDLHALTFAVVDDFLTFVRRHGQRLFNQNILAVICGQLGLLCVQDDGRCNINGIDLRVCQQILFFGVAALCAVFLTDFFNLLGIDVHDGDQFCVLGQHHAGNCSAIRNAAGANHAPT